MFRKNYVPSLNVVKSSKTNRWIAYGCGNSLGDQSFCETDEGYTLSFFSDPTQYESIDDLMKAIYDYARILHTNAVHANLTYSKPKVKL